MNDIKQWKELTKVILYDWEPIITELDKVSLDISLNNDWRFISFGDRTINKSNIKEILVFNPDDIDNYILAQPKNKRHILQSMVDERKKKWQRINIKILEALISKL